MISLRGLGVFVAASLGLASTLATEPVPEVDVTAALVVLGRLPTAGEIGPANETLPQAATRLKSQLTNDAAAAAAVGRKAYLDTFGATPKPSEMPTEPLTYAEHLQRNLRALAANANAYEAAIRAAYPIVIQREVYPEEIAYWKKHGAVPFYLLLAGIENWARRNQPGLMVTAGTPTVSINSTYLVAVRVSPVEAPAVRTLLGLAPVAGDANITAGRLLAIGGEAFATNGDMYFVAAGK